jgi:hypothetical protein
MKTQTAAYTSVIALLIAASSLMGQITVNVDTSTTIDGPNTWITQTSETTSITDEQARFRVFTFEKLDTVAGGAFANETLLAVRVTISNTLSGDFRLTLTNNDSQDFTGGPATNASINYGFPTFAFGADTTEFPLPAGPLVAPIAPGDFTGPSNQLLFRNLDGVTIEANGGTDITELTTPVTVTEIRNVAEFAFGNYQGTGSFDFNIRGEFSFSGTYIGPNRLATIETGDTEFTATVEYLVAIPEPSTYAAIFGVLALSFIVIRRRLNRR